MSITPTTVTGRELYELLPVVYRVKDEGDGSLANYLDACGVLLDQLRATLEQRLADSFPANPPGAMAAQSWLLPYFADLLDVRLVSPRLDGRREEVARAIRWRQRKGTLATIEEIAEKVGGVEVEVQEGWHRVAVTPRLNRPLLPAAAYGEAQPDPTNPLVARRHPGLPTVTVDFTLPSRAIEADAAHPRAKTTKFVGVAVPWRQMNPQGMPCFPGSYEDASRRTPDVRTPGPSRGHIHPRRLLLFVPPALGFFPFDADIVTTPQTFNANVSIEGDVINETVHVTAGRITLRNAAVKKLVVDTMDAANPVVDAVDCLFDDIEAPGGLVRLEGCTVMNDIKCRRLQASDSIFAKKITLGPAPFDPRSCVRFSRVPRGFVSSAGSHLERASITTAEPIFFTFDYCAPDDTTTAGGAFGDPAYGVLHPSTPDAIRFGAEDGGEMGADHHRATSLAHAAVATKLEEFLPLGIEAVLIPDPRLLVAPPRIGP